MTEATEHKHGLESTGSVAVICMGLVALQHVGSSWTRDRTCDQPGIESPALAGGFFTAEPPGKP